MTDEELEEYVKVWSTEAALAERAHWSVIRDRDHARTSLCGLQFPESLTRREVGADNDGAFCRACVELLRKRGDLDSDLAGELISNFDNARALENAARSASTQAPAPLPRLPAASSDTVAGRSAPEQSGVDETSGAQP